MVSLKGLSKKELVLKLVSSKGCISYQSNLIYDYRGEVRLLLMRLRLANKKVKFLESKFKDKIVYSKIKRFRGGLKDV